MNGACKPCPTNFTYQAEGAVCSKCPEGTITNGTGKTSVLDCMRKYAFNFILKHWCIFDKFVNVLQLVIFTLASLTGSCQSGQQATADRSGCELCPRGTYKAMAGVDECISCGQTAGANPQALTTRRKGETSEGDCVGKAV